MHISRVHQALRVCYCYMQRSASHCVYPQRGRMSTQETPQRELRDMIDVYSNDGESDTVWGELKVQGYLKRKSAHLWPLTYLLFLSKASFQHTQNSHMNHCVSLVCTDNLLRHAACRVKPLWGDTTRGRAHGSSPHWNATPLSPEGIDGVGRASCPTASQVNSPLARKLYARSWQFFCFKYNCIKPWAFIFNNYGFCKNIKAHTFFIKKTTWTWSTTFSFSSLLSLICYCPFLFKSIDLHFMWYTSDSLLLSSLVALPPLSASLSLFVHIFLVTLSLLNITSDPWPLSILSSPGVTVCLDT